MTSASVERPKWSFTRWAVSVTLVMALQVGLVFWLENRTPVLPHKASNIAPVRLDANEQSDFVALENPTLFALPHRQGFSGVAWLKPPHQRFPTPAWSEPLRWLRLPAQELGSAFRRFVQTNPQPRFSTIIMPEPEWTAPGSFSTTPAPKPSTLQLEGGLAQRTLISPPSPLPAWTNSEFLTNTVVQLLVDAEGRPVSVVLLPPGSGLSQADQWALEAARTARFKPEHEAVLKQENNPSAGLTVGNMVFQWKTVPGSPSPAASTPIQ